MSPEAIYPPPHTPHPDDVLQPHEMGVHVKSAEEAGPASRRTMPGVPQVLGGATIPVSESQRPDQRDTTIPPSKEILEQKEAGWSAAEAYLRIDSLLPPEVVGTLDEEKVRPLIVAAVEERFLSNPELAEGETRDIVDRLMAMKIDRSIARRRLEGSPASRLSQSDIRLFYRDVLSIVSDALAHIN